jgi:hypothetical protein
MVGGDWDADAANEDGDRDAERVGAPGLRSAAQVAVVRSLNPMTRTVTRAEMRRARMTDPTAMSAIFF